MGIYITIIIVIVILFIIAECIDQEADLGILRIYFLFAIIGCFCALFLSSYYRTNIINKYNNGRFQKEYTIRGSDTTYRYIYKK